MNLLRVRAKSLGWLAKWKCFTNQSVACKLHETRAPALSPKARTCSTIAHWMNLAKRSKFGNLQHAMDGAGPGWIDPLIALIVDGWEMRGANSLSVSRPPSDLPSCPAFRTCNFLLFRYYIILCFSKYSSPDLLQLFEFLCFNVWFLCFVGTEESCFNLVEAPSNVDLELRRSRIWSLKFGVYAVTLVSYNGERRSQLLMHPPGNKICVLKCIKMWVLKIWTAWDLGPYLYFLYRHFQSTYLEKPTKISY